MARTSVNPILLCAILALTCLLASPALAGDEPDSCEAKKPFVVKIHADWCGSCKATAVIKPMPLVPHPQPDRSGEAEVVSLVE